MPTIEDTKNKLFRKLVTDTQDDVQKYVDYLLHLFSMAFDYGFDMGYEQAKEDLDQSAKGKILISDNVE